MQLDIIIEQGKTFNYAVKLAEEVLIYKPIEQLTSRAPVRLQVNEHQMPDEWAINIGNVKKPIQLNTDVPVIATVIDENTLEINKLIIPCQLAYKGCGYIAYRKPYDLTGMLFKGTIRASVFSPTIFYQWDQIEADIKKSLITLKIPAEITKTFNWCSAVYDVEAIMPNGDIVSIIAPSKVIVYPAVTK